MNQNIKALAINFSSSIIVELLKAKAGMYLNILIHQAEATVQNPNKHIIINELGQIQKFKYYN